MQARFYAPMYHRFLSPDPARDQHFEETQSWNIYSYVQNNPIKNIDTNGMLLQDAMFNGLANAKHMEKMTDKQKQQFVKDWKTANVVGGAGGVAALAALEVGPAAVAVGGSWFSRQVDKVGAFFSNLMGGGPAVKDEVQAAVRGLQQGAEAVQKISSTGLLKVTESEGGVFMGEFQAAKGAAQVAGEAHIENGTLTLKGLDIAGKGTLKEAVALATQIGEKLGMNKVVLEMAKRTTGANPGHVPKPIEIAINR